MKEHFFHFLQLIIDAVFSMIPQRSTPLFKSKIVAHRGAPLQKRFENTISAFNDCHKMGVGGVELDVRWTRDDQPVVFHDPSLYRLYQNDSLICEMTFQQLRQNFPLIPLLSEVIQEFSNKFHFMLELKSPLSPQQEEILAGYLKSLKPVKDYHLLTLDPDILSNLTHFSTETFILVSEFNLKKHRDFVIQNNWGGFASHYLLLTSTQLKHFKSNGIQVGTGYIRSINIMRREELRGVDWHFTNHPRELINKLSF